MAPKHISIGVDIGGTHIACAAVHLLEARLIPHTRARVACDHTVAPDVILARWAS